MNSNSQHFARQLVGSASALEKGLGIPQRSILPVSKMHTSSAARAAVGLPTLGEAGMKLGASRWGSGAAESGMSVFDIKGAAEALRNGPDMSATKRVHPAALAHAARIARAQQQGVTFYGFKVFPDLTPGRAFMWGTILAVYAVGAASYGVARAAGVTSVADIREKMHDALAPARAGLQHAMGSTKSSLELRERPQALDQLRGFGAALAQTLGKPEGLLRDEPAPATMH